MPKNSWVDSLKNRIRSLSPAPRQNTAAEPLTSAAQAPEPSIKAIQATGQTAEVHPPPADKYGLFPLAGPTGSSLAEDASLDRNSIDIVAVHGLNGTAYKTWTHDNGNFWLGDLLNDFPGARVFTFGYASEVCFTRGTGNIDTFSRSLLVALDRERPNKKDQARPIIFICHSMGGIVVKKALIIAKIDDEEFKNITKSVAGIAFLSTPHRGSSQTELPLVLASVANVALSGTTRFVGSMRSDLIKSLEKDSKSLKDISTNFRNQTQNMKIASFYEQEKTLPANKLIVDDISGIMDIAGEKIVPMQGCDHRTICRFPGRESECYKIVLGVLRKWVNVINEAEINVITSEDISCLQSLSFPEINNRRQEADRAYQNTCAWILKHPVYREWLTKSCEVLWLQGYPGSGKSTLMSFISREFHKNKHLGREAVLDYFFHGGGVTLQKTRVGMFRSLLHQLYTQVHFIRPQIQAAFREKEVFGNAGIGWEWRPKECELLFSEVIISAAQSKSITLFVDALDEAGADDVGSDLESYFQQLNEKLRARNSKARICISCRRYPVIAPNDGLKISVDEENNVDIKTYVEQKLDLEIRSHGMATSTREELKELQKAVVRRSQHTFQWAYLVVPLIIKLRRDGQSLAYIMEEMNKVPQGLGKVYEHILTEIVEPQYRPKALLLMQWVCLAVSPLSVAHIRFAIASDDAYIDERRQSYSDSKDFVESDERMMALIISMSGGLVEVVNYEYNQSTVQFIHQSINDFLLSGGLKLLAQYPNPTARGENELSTSMDNIIGQSHDRLCKSCINFLKFEEVPIVAAHDFVFQMHSLPFAQYAERYWVLHAKRAESYGVSQQYLIQCLGLYPDIVFFQFAWVHPTARTAYLHVVPSKKSLLYIASITNLQSVAIQILKTHSLMVNDRDQFNEKSLYYAAYFGYCELVEILLDAEDHIGTTSMDSATEVFSAAVERGQEQVVKQLLDRGVDVSGDTIVAGNALIAAVKSTSYNPLQTSTVFEVEDNYKRLTTVGDVSLIKLLLDYGANADARGDDNRTAIEEAISSTLVVYIAYVDIVHTPAIKLLLERGADANVRCSFTPTQLEFLNKRILLPGESPKSDVEPSELDSESPEPDGSVLHVATALEDRDTATIVTELLLKKGAHVNESSIHGTALCIASARGNISVVRLLLTYGANIDESGGSSLTPLQVASARGYSELVEFLLEKGARVNLQQHDSCSALQFAASRWDTSVVKLLLDHGANVNAPAGENGTALQAASVLTQPGENLVPQLLENAMKPKEQQFCWKAEVRKMSFDEGLEDSVEIAQMLLDAGADITGPGRLLSELSVAAMQGNTAIVELLIERGSTDAEFDDILAEVLSRATYDSNYSDYSD